MPVFARKAFKASRIWQFTNVSGHPIVYCSNGSMTAPMTVVTSRTRVMVASFQCHWATFRRVDLCLSDPCLQGFSCTMKTSANNAQFTMCTCKSPYKSNGTVWARPDRKSWLSFSRRPTKATWLSVVALLAQIGGQCGSKPLQFDCGGGVCIDMAKFRDCNQDCPNRSDECKYVPSDDVMTWSYSSF